MGHQVHGEALQEVSDPHPAAVSATRDQPAEAGEGPGQRDTRESGPPE